MFDNIMNIDPTVPLNGFRGIAGHEPPFAVRPRTGGRPSAEMFLIGPLPYSRR
ncbi:hypothetical protein [Novacetimonas pomaceti]|uniref:hypothetical protein n=1 Tax=Novacetimonas pomaceti TaxID=2021998 RepID=UPI0014033811|nr:hypothetical protein [Novacetimonas pomaceti]